MAVYNLEDMILYPQEVRNVLNIDNKGIINLCKKANIKPKVNSKGLTYFSYNEVQKLKKVQQEKQKIIPNNQTAIMSNIKKSFAMMENNISSNVMEKIEKKISEKFENMEEIVFELIQCQNEIKNLKQENNKLKIENQLLKDGMEKYKKIGFGVFYKERKKNYTI